MSETGHGHGRSKTMSATDWDERYGEGRLWSVEPNGLFAEVVNGFDRQGRAVDLACGEGRNALWLATQGWDVTAVDFSAVGVDRGRAYGAEHGIDVDWKVADLTTWDLGRRAWDLLAHVYLHWGPAEREPFLDGCAAAVAPGGHLVVIGHDRTNIEHGHGGPQDPALLTTAEELRARFEAAGLTVERAETVLRPVTVEREDGSTTQVNAIDHLVVATRS
ncbi:MAG: class I SAM-dependent methyltransferase [Acidimicrobiia bacterium]|nr:class I SAM-dependent methyltransferase [Acidimicrobiia bacterium]